VTRRAHVVGLFVVYLALLVWVVLWKLEPPSLGVDRAVKLVPFVASGGAGPSAPVEVAANLVLFIPFGLYLGLLAPGRRWWAAVGSVAGTSLALEVGQYVLGVGRSDSTDIIMNTAGGLVGLGLVALARPGQDARAATALARACSLATVLVLLVAGLYLASPWRPVHVRDVGVAGGIPSSLPEPR
jgi:glycopeptide antibiotics resistance protein